MPLRKDLRQRLYATAALLCLTAQNATAQPSPKRAQVARLPASQAPRIDGQLDDSAWAGQAPIEDFAQQRPLEGADPTERTQVFICYDDEALYVGARMFRQEPRDIARSVTRRDGQGNAERLQITFDTQRDRRKAYAFCAFRSHSCDSQPQTFRSGDFNWTAGFLTRTKISSGS